MWTCLCWLFSVLAVCGMVLGVWHAPIDLYGHPVPPDFANVVCLMCWFWFGLQLLDSASWHWELSSALPQVLLSSCSWAFILLDENIERWRDGLRGVSPVRGSPRTKIRAEGSSNLS